MSRRFPVAAFGIALLACLAALGQSPTRTEDRSSPTEAADKQQDGDTAKDQAKPKNKPKDTDSDKEKGKDKNSSTASKKPVIETATFGGGCFWCMEAVFERVPGVTSVVSGFAGGTTRNPTYAMVCTGLTGHAEVVQIEFDPAKISYAKLLSIFFAAHDPTSLNRQEDDFGTQYRSIILYHNHAQKEAVEKTINELVRRHAFRSPIVTEVVPFSEFYPAEPYHQDYFRNHQGSPYSNIHIVPKLRNLRQMLKGSP
jgi:peptide-methionine (S)-S-oxide reductase